MSVPGFKDAPPEVSGPSTRIRNHLAAALACLLAACAAPPAARADDATIVFSTGQAHLTTHEGRTLRVRKGQALGAGQLLRTGTSGHVQLRFRDGTYVSLQPSTDLRLDAYRYHAGPDAGELAAFTLYRGSARFMTGAIGKLAGSRFRVATPVAALELHGSEVVATFAQDLRVAVGGGAVDVRNDGGVLSARSGQRVLVRDRRTAPVLIGSLLPQPVVPDR
jgi:hypothetical protein